MKSTPSDQGHNLPADIEGLRRELEEMAKRLKPSLRPKPEHMGSVLVLKGK